MSSIKEKVRSFYQSSPFARNLLIVFSGSSLSFLAQVILTPIITRLYTPEAYGYFAVFNSTVINLTRVLSLSLPMGIVVVKKHEVNRLSSLSFFVSTAIFTVVQLTFIAFAPWFEKTFSVEGLGIFTYLIPVTAYIMAVNGIFMNLNIRQKRFKVNSVAEVSKSWGSRSILVGLGLLQAFQKSGLIISEIAGKLINGSLMVRPANVRERLLQRKNYRSQILRNSWKKFRSYPLLVFPATQLNVMSASLPVFLFSYYLSRDVVGSYTLVISLLEIPIRVFGTSMLPVLMQRSAEDILNQRGLGKVPLKMTGALAILALAIYGTVFLFGEWAFPVILGDKWALAGEFARYMALYYGFKFITTPLKGLFNATRQEKRLFRLNLITFLIKIAIIPFFYYIEDPVMLILVLAILNIIAELITLQSVWRLSKKFQS